MKHYQWKPFLIFPMLNAIHNLQFVKKDCFQRAKQKKNLKLQFLAVIRTRLNL